MTELKKRVDGAAGAIAKRIGFKPSIGIILGTGLGGLAAQIEETISIPYADVPGFPKTTVSSHTGRLVAGNLSGKKVVALEGRFHLYEGWSLQDITLPVRVIKALGCKILIVSNAAGGINPLLKRGDVVIIEDHINLMGVNPLIGPNDDDLGPRFPDMSEPYSHRLIDIAEQVALSKGLRIRTGIYAAMTGPCLETRAEYRMLKMLGADLIGMSTVPEVIAGVHAGLEILGLSLVTDICLPDALKPTGIDEIIAVANAAEPKLTAIVTGVVGKL